jgi:hypothetical protein
LRSDDDLTNLDEDTMCNATTQGWSLHMAGLPTHYRDSQYLIDSKMTGGGGSPERTALPPDLCYQGLIQGFLIGFAEMRLVLSRQSLLNSGDFSRLSLD